MTGCLLRSINEEMQSIWTSFHGSHPKSIELHVPIHVKFVLPKNIGVDYNWSA
jgi:hypothetical protein